MIDLDTMSVLIVDDMEGMCKSIRSMMKVLRFGKTFHYARNGLEALKILKSDVTVDLTISDWNMPVMNGVELLERIREDRDLRDIPIVMITAEANREIVAEAGESDIDAYILKPLTVKSLGDKITWVVDKANNPPPMVSFLRTARDHEEKGDIRQAIKAAQSAVKSDPTSSRPIRELGYYYHKAGLPEKAEQCWLKAIRMNQLDVYSFHHLGVLYTELDDIDNAAKYYDKAMKISPRHISRGIDFAKILIQKGLTDKAISVFDKIIRLSREPLSTREQIADLCFEHGIYGYASAHYEFLTTHLPDRYDLMFKQALCLQYTEDHRQAISCLLNVEKFEGRNPDIKIHLAENYLAIGQVLRAEQALKFVLSIDPQHEEARQMLKKCL